MAEWSEGVIAFVDPKNTSQLCSGCGERIMKDLSMRVHVCPYCEFILDRDVNAARNTLQRGLEIGRGPPEYTLAGVEIPTHLSEGMQVASMKGSPPFQDWVVHTNLKIEHRMIEASCHTSFHGNNFTHLVSLHLCLQFLSNFSDLLFMRLKLPQMIHE